MKKKKKLGKNAFANSPTAHVYNRYILDLAMFLDENNKVMSFKELANHLNKNLEVKFSTLFLRKMKQHITYMHGKCLSINKIKYAKALTKSFIDKHIDGIFARD